VVSPREISASVRRFDFETDCFAFANELLWEYRPDPVSGRMEFRPRSPRPSFTHRCFVLVRAARQFFYHARFDPARPAAEPAVYRNLIRAVLSRNPRKPSPSGARLTIPGYAHLREFSGAHESPIKSACGGPWRSYVLRSHWRMVFPISRAHQAWAAQELAASLGRNVPALVHLVKFPSLTMNHGMLVFAVAEHGSSLAFSAYDPNDPALPARLTFDRAAGAFSLPSNRYWSGGTLNIIPIYRTWWM